MEWIQAASVAHGCMVPGMPRACATAGKDGALFSYLFIKQIDGCRDQKSQTGITLMRSNPM
jgi:hypothetical protein